MFTWLNWLGWLLTLWTLLTFLPSPTTAAFIFFLFLSWIVLFTFNILWRCSWPPATPAAPSSGLVRPRSKELNISGSKWSYLTSGLTAWAETRSGSNIDICQVWLTVASPVVCLLRTEIIFAQELWVIQPQTFLVEGVGKGSIPGCLDFSLVDDSCV